MSQLNALRQIKHPFQHKTITTIHKKTKQKIKVQDKHMKLYEIISCNRFTNLPLFSVPFLSDINYN